MPFMDPFKSIVTTTKVNNRYYGPTESAKMRSFLSSVLSDFDTIFAEINKISDNILVLASGYLVPSDDINSLNYMKRKIYHLESKLNDIIDTQAQQLEES